MAEKTIIIAGGGTGGHIYPGVAVARAILKDHPESRIVFVGTPEGLESKILPREGFPLELIQVGKLNHGGGIFGKILTVVKIPVSFWQSYRILKKYEPQAVLGVGGYASGPFVLIASLMGYPTALWEANAHPGMTNRWLSHFVRKAYLVFDEARKSLSAKKFELVGLPVRSEIENPPSFQTSSEFRILVFGGSQGARALNRVVSEAVAQGGPWLENVKITHQTGKNDFPEIQKAYEGKKSVEAFEFLYDMHDQYSRADLVICRAGAGTVTELAACGRVSILVPLPTAADNHQQKNAELLVKHDAGVMILQKDLTALKLIEEIQKLKADPARCQQISKNIKSLFLPRAAQTMAAELFGGLV